jgi:hypothetical protein
LYNGAYVLPENSNFKGFARGAASTSSEGYLSDGAMINFIKRVALIKKWMGLWYQRNGSVDSRIELLKKRTLSNRKDITANFSYKLEDEKCHRGKFASFNVIDSNADPAYRTSTAEPQCC